MRCMTQVFSSVLFDKERSYICGENASSPHVGVAERRDCYLGQRSVLPFYLKYLWSDINSVDLINVTDSCLGYEIIS